MFMSFLKESNLKYCPFKLEMPARNSDFFAYAIVNLWQIFKIFVTKIVHLGG